MAAEVALLCGDQPGFLRLHPERLNDLLTTKPIHELFEVEEEPFARGKYAAVRRCRDRETGEPFAAKFLRKRRRSTDLKSEIVHEVAVLEACSKCPRIVRLYRVLESDSEMVLVLELAPGGELQMLLDRDEVPEEAEAARLMAQILDGIAYLHSINVAHLDIKPQNLVLTGEFPHCDVKLCDFGISRYISNGADIREILGTPDYVAPEVLNYEPISLATDMWSVGVLLYVLLTGCSPFGGDSKQETFCNISQSKLDFPADLFGDISEEAIDLIQKLLVKEPSKRLTAQECLQHQWFCKFSNGVVKHPPVISPIGTTPSKSKTSVLNGNPTEKKNKPAKEDREESPSSNSINTTAQIKGKSPVHDGKHDIPPVLSSSTEKSGKVEVSGVNGHGISPVRRNGFAQNMNNILERLEDVPKSPTLSTPTVQRTKALAMRTMPANATYTFINIDKNKPINNQNENKILDANTNKVERHFPPARQKTDCIYKIRRCYIEDTDEEEDDDIPPPLPPTQPPSQQLLHGSTHLRLLSCAKSTSPAPSSSSGCSSGSSSAEGHSDHGSDVSSDATSEISGDSSSDRSSIISIDDTLDIPCSKRMSLFPASYNHSNSSSILCDSWDSSTFGRISSKHRMNQINQRQLHITNLRTGQTSVRQVSQRWERECVGSWQTAFNRFQSTETQVQHKDLNSKSTQSNLLSMRSIKRFDGSVPFGLNEIGSAKKCSVQLERENNGNVVVIRELKSGKYSHFNEVKCESIQARIRKLQEQAKS